MTTEAYPGEQRSGETTAELQPLPTEPPVNAGVGERICPNSPINHPTPAPPRSGAHKGDGAGNTGSEAIENGPGEKAQPDHSLPAVEPFPQLARAAKSCRTCTACAYCGEKLDGPHDHDHAPIPWRHGGREVVPACLRCHSLKDRIKFESWPPSALEAAEAGVHGDAVLIIQVCTAMIEGHDCDPAIPRDVALRGLNACTTAEARISFARIVAKSIDISKKRRASGILDDLEPADLHSRGTRPHLKAAA